MEVEAFKHLLERDESENKEVARKEFAYIYHIVDPLSNYATYEDDTRKEKVKEDIFGEKTDWVEDAYVRKAMEVYEDVNMTEAQKLLKSAKRSAKTLREYFEEVDLTETDDRGKLKWSAKDLMNNLSRIGEVIEGIKSLEDQVEKELMESGELRGGVKLNQFNQ